MKCIFQKIGYQLDFYQKTDRNFTKSFLTRQIFRVASLICFVDIYSRSSHQSFNFSGYTTKNLNNQVQSLRMSDFFELCQIKNQIKLKYFDMKKVALLICFVVHSGTCLGTRSWSGRTGRRITTIFLVSIVISTIHYQKN